MTDALIITDCNSQNSVLSAVISRLAEKDIGWKNIEMKILTAEEQQLLTEFQEPTTRQEFAQKLAKAPKLDIEQLKIYSQITEPLLYNDLAHCRNLEDSLWDSFQRSSKGNTWELAPHYRAVIVDEASKCGYPNVIELLFNYKLTAVQFGDENFVPYHMIGRGFVAEGVRLPLWNKEDKETGKSAVIIPVSLVANKTQEIQKAYALELVNHEVLGHTILGLKDHLVTDKNPVQPAECTMSIPVSREEFVELAQKGLRFCKECSAVYRTHIK
jgi:hypothetical protein